VQGYVRPQNEPSLVAFAVICGKLCKPQHNRTNSATIRVMFENGRNAYRVPLVFDIVACFRRFYCTRASSNCR